MLDLSVPDKLIRSSNGAKRKPMPCRSTEIRAATPASGRSSHEQPRAKRGEGKQMIQSHVVDIDGTFVGAAVVQTDGYRFVAVDVRLDELDGRIWPSLAAVRRDIRAAYLVARLAPGQGGARA